MRILLIEDDQGVANALISRLSASFTVDLAATGRGGLHLAQVCQYDLILLDLQLPDLHGRDICRQIRQRRIATPIIILTGEMELGDKVESLDAGADDYLTKPFHYHELVARIRAQFRRPPLESTTNQLSADNLVLDPIHRTVVRGHEVVKLRRKEFDLLEYLLRHKNRVINRQTLIERLWDDDRRPYDGVIDVHIKHLRDKIDRPDEKELIKTIYGIGYQLSD